MGDINKISERLRELIKEKKISQRKLAKLAGITHRTVWDIIHKKHDVRYETLQKIANALGVKISDITGETEEIEREKEFVELQKEKLKEFIDKIIDSQSKMKAIPIYGRIPAGYPRENWQDFIEDYMSIAGVSEDAFVLRVSGDSMIREGIEDGDLVVVEPNYDIINGNIVVAAIDGTEFTLKKLEEKGNKVILRPANRRYKSIVFTKEQAKERLYIFGVVVGVYKNKVKKGIL